MKIKISAYISVVLFLVLSFFASAIDEPTKFAKRKTDPKKLWVDSVYNQMTRQERIAQLIMIRAHSDKTPKYHEEIAELIRTYKVGGLCFFQGGPIRQAILTNYYQSIANVPLMIAIDGEWGASMRLDSMISFPRQMTLGAIQNNGLIYTMGKAIAEQCKMLGITMNFAPVADVNNNPNNPVINTRSFGEDTKNVSDKSIAYMLGMQDYGLMACAKHFPGHGDTESDSHLTLPIINVSKDSLNLIHLPPFKNLINNCIDAVMIAHLFVPCIDTTTGLPSTLSTLMVDSLLIKTLGFKGLIFTDALEMKGVSNYFANGIKEVKALKAGVDVLLMPYDVKAAIDSIDSAMVKGELDSLQIEFKVKKVLGYKYDNIGKTFKPINIDSISGLLNPKSNEVLIQQLFDNAITLIKNEKSILPLSRNDSLKIAFVSVGRPIDNSMFQQAKQYRNLDFFEIADKEKPEILEQISTQLKGYSTVVVNLINTNQLSDKDYNISSTTIDFLAMISDSCNLVLHHAGNPYILKKILARCNPKAILISYDDNRFSFNSAVKALFGTMDISGKLPVTINNDFKVGCGIDVKKIFLKRSTEFYAKEFKAIDAILMEGINEKAYPGAQVIIVKNGVIIYEKSVGKPSYNSIDTINNKSMYDLASVTKVLATTLAVMKLTEEGKINLDGKASDYLKWLKGSDKEDLVIRSIMAHQARLTPFISFYEKTISNKSLDKQLYRTSYSNEFSIEVANNIFLLSSYKDSIYKQIAESKLLSEEKYKYSDLSMYIMKEIVETVSGMSLDEYLYENFYRSLGLESTFYNPLKHVEKSRIVPTSIDNYFRLQLIQGYVHDPGSAMMGGIAGHAGLFSTAEDVAILLQMLVQNGEYDGKRYLKASTIEEFTRQQFPDNDNRRGLGFDKPYPNQSKSMHCSAAASANSYGHSGFTGTFVWVDPDLKLTYIFLSNRVNSNEKNNKITELNIRTRIQDEIYKVMK